MSPCDSLKQKQVSHRDGEFEGEKGQSSKGLVISGSQMQSTQFTSENIPEVSIHGIDCYIFSQCVLIKGFSSCKEVVNGLNDQEGLLLIRWSFFTTFSLNWKQKQRHFLFLGVHMTNGQACGRWRVGVVNKCNFPSYSDCVHGCG